MMGSRFVTFASLWLASTMALAGDGNLTVDSAVGGGLGGAAGGAIGAELGGREGAIIGAGVGAAVGAAVTTSDHTTSEAQPLQGAPADQRATVYPTRRQSTFCPPGQAKKGRC
jgi:outer membrane lipoprotein SlyB